MALPLVEAPLEAHDHPEVLDPPRGSIGRKKLRESIDAIYQNNIHKRSVKILTTFGTAQPKKI